MLTKERINVGVVTHTQVISRNELDKDYCAQNINIKYIKS